MKHLIALVALAAFVVGQSQAASVSVSGAQTFQTIDGYGVNVNAGWWNGGEVKPAIDLLVDHFPRSDRGDGLGNQQ